MPLSFTKDIKKKEPWHQATELYHPAHFLPKPWIFTLEIYPGMIGVSAKLSPSSKALVCLMNCHPCYSLVVYLGGSVPTQWEVGVKILKHLCVPVTKVQAHLLSTFSIELIAIVLTVNRCVRCLVTNYKYPKFGYFGYFGYFLAMYWYRTFWGVALESSRALISPCLIRALVDLQMTFKWPLRSPTTSTQNLGTLGTLVTF